MRLPWFERKPELLKREIDSFAAKGFILSINELLRQTKKIIVFDGEVKASDGSHRIRIVYPSGFPEIGPDIYDLEQTYERHQDPYQKTLCLPTWNVRLTGADRLKEAVDLFNYFFENPEIIKEKEIDAPEAASTWYPYGDNRHLAHVIIPSPFIHCSKDNYGEFTLKVSPFGINEAFFQSALIKMSNSVSGNEIELKNEVFNAGESIKGNWIKVNEHPPFSIKNFDDFEKWVQAQENSDKFTSKNKGHKKNPIITKAIAVVYPEEGPKRGEYHDQWLIGFFKKGINETKYLLRPSLLNLGEEYYIRQPSLKKLKEKGVIIVGLGTLGSRVSLELARSGVGKFYLIDPDTFTAGNFIRQEGDIRLTGYPKVIGIRALIKCINPEADVKFLYEKLGTTFLSSEGHVPDNIVHFSEIIDQYDVVVSAIADEAVEFIINDILIENKKPGIFTSVTNGAWGGQIFRLKPEGACLECLGYHKKDSNDGYVNFDPNEQPLYVTGCHSPTFIGAGFDTGIIANLTTRLTVQTLLSGEDDSYPDCEYNLLNCSSRGDQIGDFPNLQKIYLNLHPRCRNHV